MPDTIEVDLKQEKDFRFAILFAPTMPMLFSDEPPPLGKATGPSPVQLLTAAVGNCLADSLLFSARKFGQAPDPLNVEAEAIIERNERGRLRIQGIQVRLRLGVSAKSLVHMDSVLAQFEDFCTVTESVREGIPVTVEVFDSEGTLIK